MSKIIKFMLLLKFCGVFVLHPLGDKILEILSTKLEFQAPVVSETALWSILGVNIKRFGTNALTKVDVL